MFYKIEIDKILCSLKLSTFSFLEASLERTNKFQEIQLWLIFLYALDAIERMKDWMKDTVWEQMMKDKRYCTPYSLPDVSLGVLG